jgi:hypothetical protein
MLRVILTFCLIFVFCAVGFAQNGDAGKEESKKKVLFKADSEFSAELETPIDAEKAKIGEDINFKLAEDFKGQGEKISKDSPLYGRIISLQKASDGNEKTSSISVRFDFVKHGDDFVPLTASIVSVEKAAAEVKVEPSDMDGGTVLSLKGDNLKIDKGAIFRIKLTKDITEN